MDNYTLISENWPRILNKIKVDHDLTSVSFTSWLEPLEIRSADTESITFVVPSGIMGINVLNKKYTLAIKVAIAEITGLNLDIRYVTPDQVAPVENKEADNFTKVMEKAHLNPKYTFDTFVVGSNNKFAHAASLAVAESPGEIYNPLFLYAGVGLGEEFTNELIDSIRNNSTNNSVMSRFRDKYRNIDVLLIDDIQFLINKASTQEEFFHTFEALYGAKKQIIISSDKPPKDLDVLEERIRSRLEMGLIADISLPDYETRMAILKKKEDLDGYHIDNAILDYIAKNIKSNIRELEGCLNRIRAKSILEKRTITLDLAEEILKDMISPDENRAVTSTMIIDAVAEHFHLTPQEIRSQKRDTKYVYPRKIAMYLCRVMTEDSLMTIAGYLNKKDHTTVISACRKIEKEMTTNPETRNNVETIKKKISPAK